MPCARRRIGPAERLVAAASGNPPDPPEAEKSRFLMPAMNRRPSSDASAGLVSLVSARIRLFGIGLIE
jgi:hypothetical protein